VLLQVAIKDKGKEKEKAEEKAEGEGEVEEGKKEEEGGAPALPTLQYAAGCMGVAMPGA
jgi:hypothetical protein